MLEVENISCALDNFTLAGITFAVRDGDYFVMLGRSGAGKTVLLELLCGFIRPSAGRIRMDGNDITFEPPGRRLMAIVYQDKALFPHMTVRENIAYALPRNLRPLADRLASDVGAAHLLDRYPGTLSQGESQRVALARALARKPRILLLDEPTASLDTPARSSIRSLLRKINSAGQTIIHVTHDYEEALALATRVAVLEEGRIVQAGTPDEVFHRPKSEFVANFTGIPNFFRGIVRCGEDGCLFETAGVAFRVADDAPPGPACAVFPSDCVTLSLCRPEGSARNVFQALVMETEQARHGIDAVLDIGIRIHALVTRSAARELDISAGRRVWAAFKASSVRVIPAEG